MENIHELTRRKFLAASGVLAGAAPWGRGFQQENKNNSQGGQEIPLRIGHRAANMNMVGNLEVFKVAKQIPGLMGVELQVTAGKPSLLDLDAVRQYKREANRWGMIIPSLAGVWSKGSSIRSPLAGIDLMQSIRASELLGASLILIAFFHLNVPDMKEEASYGPVVELLHRVAPFGADAGVTLGLENSLNPAENLKFVDLIDRPNVKVYYDLYNMAFYGYPADAIPGIALLGKQRICQVHVKNGPNLIAEPGPIDWPAAFEAFNDIAYEGWYIFEEEPAQFTDHRSQLQMMEAAKKNIEFVKQHCRMPLG